MLLRRIWQRRWPMLSAFGGFEEAAHGWNQRWQSQHHQQHHHQQQHHAHHSHHPPPHSHHQQQHSHQPSSSETESRGTEIKVETIITKADEQSQVEIEKVVAEEGEGEEGEGETAEVGKKVIGRIVSNADDHEAVNARAKGPLFYYDLLAARKEIRLDLHQRRALQPLQTLHEQLSKEEEQRRLREASTAGSSKAAEQGGFLSSVFSLFRSSSSQATTAAAEERRLNGPQMGLYMYGDVGCGKTFLMDLFYECCPVHPKRRVHFHAFMLDVHRRIHRWRKECAAIDAKSALGDPIPPLVKTITAEARVLCFDEFQVTDVADAMILNRIFRQLIDEHGVVTVCTSNRPPDDLYKNGLNRHLFLPFIAFLKERAVIHNLNSGVDYRLSGGRGHHTQVYYAPLGAASSQALDRLFQQLSHHEKVSLQVALPIPHTSRTLLVPRCARGVARFSFAELCTRPLAAADYLTLAANFHTVIVDDIPQMSPAEKIEARRFITLIDALYEHKVKLLCSAAAHPVELFKTFNAAEAAEEETFAFSRAVSRILEMQTSEYLEAAHIIPPQ